MRLKEYNSKERWHAFDKRKEEIRNELTRQRTLIIENKKTPAHF